MESMEVLEPVPSCRDRLSAEQRAPNGWHYWADREKNNRQKHFLSPTSGHCLFDVLCWARGR